MSKVTPGQDIQPQTSSGPLSPPVAASTRCPCESATPSKAMQSLPGSVMPDEGRQRVVITGISPSVDGGRFPARRIIGDEERVEAVIFADAHESISAIVRFRHEGDAEWREIPMAAVGNDIYQAPLLLDRLGKYFFTIEAWIDRRLGTTMPKPFEIAADPVLARFGAWYQIFPRSCSSEPGWHGTFRDVASRLERIAAMGFDVVHFPPIHPIGATHRKGPNGCLTAAHGDPGSPWAIGDGTGGHKSVHRQLGSLSEFRELLAVAQAHGLEIAFDPSSTV